MQPKRCCEPHPIYALRGLNAATLTRVAKQRAVQARDRLRELCLEQVVVIRTHQDRAGKYGRWLATVLVDGVDLNRLLVDEGLADAYADRIEVRQMVREFNGFGEPDEEPTL